jgi:hypothetical protein
MIIEALYQMSPHHGLPLKAIHGYDGSMMFMREKMLTALLLLAGCQQIDNQPHDDQPRDTGTHADTETSSINDADSDRSEFDDTDSGLIPYTSSLCDALDETQCQHNVDCNRITVVDVHPINEGTELQMGCNSKYFGCTSKQNCYANTQLALDPEGACWWTGNGCLPHVPGWLSAIHHEYCSPPVAFNSCIE